MSIISTESLFYVDVNNVDENDVDELAGDDELINIYIEAYLINSYRSVCHEINEVLGGYYCIDSNDSQDKADCDVNFIFDKADSDVKFVLHEGVRYMDVDIDNLELDINNPGVPGLKKVVNCSVNGRSQIMFNGEYLKVLSSHHIGNINVYHKLYDDLIRCVNQINFMSCGREINLTNDLRKLATFNM